MSPTIMSFDCITSSRFQLNRNWHDEVCEEREQRFQSYRGRFINDMTEQPFFAWLKIIEIKKITATSNLGKILP